MKKDNKVYIIKTTRKIVKIGATNRNIQHRLNRAKTWILNPKLLFISYEFTEKELHHLFDKYRLDVDFYNKRRELFKYNSKIKRFIKRNTKRNLIWD